MFHGTNGVHAASIIQNGLHPSAGGRLGGGVYCTPDKDAANAIAKHRGLHFVLECEVTPSNVYDHDAGTAPLAAKSMAWAAHGFDAATSIHPAWAGVAAPFREYCISDAQAVRVIKVEGYVNAPTGT